MTDENPELKRSKEMKFKIVRLQKICVQHQSNIKTVYVIVLERKSYWPWKSINLIDGINKNISNIYAVVAIYDWEHYFIINVRWHL